VIIGEFLCIVIKQKTVGLWAFDQNCHRTVAQYTKI